MKLIINKDRSVIPVGTWGTVNENNYEILEFEFPAELDGYNKRIVYYLGDEKVWDTIVNNKAYITNAITTKGDVQAYVWCTKENTEREADTDFRTMLFEMHFYENENADGIVPTEQQVDGFNTMLTAMNNKIAEVNALEQTIGAAEAQRQDAEATRVSNENTRESNESTRQTNEQTRQSQEADRERRTNEAISSIQDKTAEYNANAEAKTTAFNNNATQKTNDFNSNYTQKVNDFNTNASSKELAFNSNASSKTSDFNSNVETKTNAFNTNATNKTNDFNSNATEKTTAFDNNASTKTSEFNTNAESKTSAFNDNATQKTTNFDNNASDKTTAFNENAQAKTEAFDEHTEEMQQEIDELSANMPWGETEQATEIQVTDAAKYSRNKLELFGNTEQAQYEGTNLSELANYSETLSNLAIEWKTDNNLVKFNGTYTANINSEKTNRIKTPFILRAGETYYIHVKKISGTHSHLTSNKATAISFIVGNGRINWVISDSSDPHIQSTQLTPSEDTTINSIRLLVQYGSNDTTFDDYTLQFWVSSNSEPDYEPFFNGQSSPSPDYPQDIHVVTGNNTISVGNTDYPINLGSIELCKIGNYQDYLYKENGNWYKYEAIKKYIINENTEFYVSKKENESVFCFQIGNQTSLTSNNNFLRSNFYPNKVAFSTYACTNIYNKDVWFSNPYDSNFTPEMTETEATAKFHELYDNKLYYYTVKQSNPTQITDETLIAQLEAIYNHLALVKGTNHITITPSDLEPYVTLNYMQDLPAKLDNLDSRLSLLE